MVTVSLFQYTLLTHINASLGARWLGYLPVQHMKEGKKTEGLTVDHSKCRVSFFSARPGGDHTVRLKLH